MTFSSNQPKFNDTILIRWKFHMKLIAIVAKFSTQLSRALMLSTNAIRLT